MGFWNRNKNKKLPMGTKEQGGLETFKFKSYYNLLDDKFFISLTSRKSFHTARLNLTAEEYANILNNMVKAYERVIYPDKPQPLTGIKDPTLELRSRHIDPDDEMKGL